MSAVYGTSPIKRARRTRAEAEELDAQIYEVAKDNQPATVRGIFYRCTVAGIVPKEEAKGYRVVQRRLAEMRRAGILPYAWIADSSRRVVGQDRYENGVDFLTSKAASYRLDYWARQDKRIELWIEKEALVGVLMPTVTAWGLNLYPTRGFPSLSYLEAAASVVRYYEKRTEIIILTDLDPSGIVIAQKIGDELTERAPEVEINVRRLAVTIEQVELMALPTRPNKTTDSRERTFRKEYGTGSVELDAIPPHQLRQMVSDAIEAHADSAEFQRLKVVERLERESLREFAAAYEGNHDGSEYWQ